jgi:CDP-diacylglycerol--serine O-phosphatidyltransferase
MKFLQLIKNNIPNAITCLNLLSGALACIYAFHSAELFGTLTGYEVAFIFIGAAAVFDFCDGFAARLLHATSPIGKELDSLSDSISFGLAPAMLVYSMLEASCPNCPVNFLALLIAVFGALRLARFNTDTTQTTTFVGMPIPANAIFWIGFCAWNYGLASPLPQWAVLIFVVVLSLLMVCPKRMFSLKFKNYSLKDNLFRYLLIVATIVFVLTLGLTGFACAILFYVILSFVTKVKA